MNTEEAIKICEMVAKDAADDAANFDGKPFTGRTVAEYFGNHGAAICSLANVLKFILEEKTSGTSQTLTRQEEDEREEQDFGELEDAKLEDRKAREAGELM